jgi:hypothetical protein
MSRGPIDELCRRDDWTQAEIDCGSAVFKTRDGCGQDSEGCWTARRAVKFSAEDVIIAPEKLRDYILSPKHPEGRAKATYLARIGYRQTEWRRLDADLRGQILKGNAKHAKPSPYGQKYEILGRLTGPNGTSAWVRTIWIVLVGETVARLVTLIPGGEA